jgi:outer membrane immunogenic protein
MKKLLVLGIALGALAAPAMAADMKVKAPILKAPPPVFSWTGCYIGGNGGWKWGRFHETDTTPDVTSLGLTVPAAAVSVDPHGDSVVAGGQVGCRYQTSQHWVLGLEGDLDWVNNLTASQMLTDPLTPSPFVQAIGAAPGDTFTMRQRWESSIRGSLGYSADRFLLYVTGGVAFTRVDKVADYPAVTLIGAAPIFFPATAGADSHTLIGWTIGAGAAYAFDRNWELGAEYRYTAYSSQNFNVGPVAAICGPAAGSCTFAPVTGSTDLRTSEVLVKLNYRLGWMGP